MTQSHAVIDIEVKVAKFNQQLAEITANHLANFLIENKLIRQEECLYLIKFAIKLLDFITALDTQSDLNLTEFMNDIATSKDKFLYQIKRPPPKSLSIETELKLQMRELTGLIKNTEEIADHIAESFIEAEKSYNDLDNKIKEHLVFVKNNAAVFKTFLKSTHKELEYFQLSNSTHAKLTTSNGHAVLNQVLSLAHSSNHTLELFKSNLKILLANAVNNVFSKLLRHYNGELNPNIRANLNHTYEVLSHYVTLSPMDRLKYSKHNLLKNLTNSLINLVNKSPIIKAVRDKEQAKMPALELPRSDIQHQRTQFSSPSSAVARNHHPSSVLSGAGSHSIYAEKKRAEQKAPPSAHSKRISSTP